MAPRRRCRGLGQAAGLAAAGCLGAAAVLLNTCNFVQVPGLHVARPQRATRRLAEEEREEKDADARTPVSELEVGQEVGGVVRRDFGFVGYFVDVGADKNGLLEFEELVDGFPGKNDQLRKGDFVTARVLETDGLNFYLTRRTGDLTRPPRFRQKPKPEEIEAFSGVPNDEWLQGEVAGMWTKGVWVKIAPPSGGQPVRGLVNREEFTDDFQKEVFRGMKVMVRVTGIDISEKRVDITMRDP